MYGTMSIKRKNYVKQFQSLTMIKYLEYVRNADRAILNNADHAVLNNADRAVLNNADRAILNTVFENTVRGVNKCLETGGGQFEHYL
jgi:hypothetical protein